MQHLLVFLAYYLHPFFMIQNSSTSWSLTYRFPTHPSLPNYLKIQALTKPVHMEALREAFETQSGIREIYSESLRMLCELWPAAVNL